MKNKSEPERAREYSFLLLKYRLRSVNELKGRLKAKGFSAEVVRDTADFLKERRFLDDRQFCRAWISSRLKRPWGFRRIRQELRFKGVDKEIVEEQARELSKGYAEAEIIKEIAEKRLNNLKGLEPVKARERVYSYLIRRGFTPETVIDTVNLICKQTS